MTTPAIINESTHFSDPADFHQIDFPDGSWVRVKKQLSVADYDRIQQGLVEIEGIGSGMNRAERRAMRGGQGQQQGQQQAEGIKAKFRPSTVLLLTISILSWSFTRPVTPETIATLSQATARHIESVVDELNPT